MSFGYPPERDERDQGKDNDIGIWENDYDEAEFDQTTPDEDGDASNEEFKRDDADIGAQEETL
jgi:hypothetical protein